MFVGYVQGLGYIEEGPHCLYYLVLLLEAGDSFRCCSDGYS